MDSVMCATCSDSEDDELQEADNFKGAACTVNISKRDATLDIKPPDIKRRRINEAEKQEPVAREDPGKSAKALQVDRSNAANYVSKILNPGGSEVQKKKKNLIEDGQGPSSKLVKESEGPQESQMPCASGGSSTDTFQTNLKPDIKPLLSQFLKWMKNNKTEYAAQVPKLCTKCNVTFRSPELLKKHRLEAHSTEESFTCPDCNKPFPSPGGVIDHRAAMHNAEKIYQCSYCNTIAKGAALLNQHHRLCHGLSVKCAECSEEFSSSELWKQHQWEVHNSGKPLKCGICSETFIDFTEFSHHQKSHTFECRVCTMTFNKVVKLRKHEKTHMDSQIIESVKNNKAVNAGEVPNHCTKCNISFSSSARLNQHCEKAHSTEESFKCPNCNKTFPSPGGVIDHRIKKHKAEKIYKCSYCKTIKNSAALLNQHHRLDHGLSLKCAECSEEFPSLVLRKQHQLEVHSNRNLLKCYVCNKTFDFINFMKHRKSHMFQCPVCNMTFNKLVKLHKHKKTHVDSRS